MKTFEAYFVLAVTFVLLAVLYFYATRKRRSLRRPPHRARRPEMPD